LKKTQKPKIPQDCLTSFIESKTTSAQAVYFNRIDCTFLWESGDVQRFRINIWVEKNVEGSIYPHNYIGHSFFVHYDKLNGEVIDKSVGRLGSYSKFCR
jgi:hypothetical protein